MRIILCRTANCDVWDELVLSEVMVYTACVFLHLHGYVSVSLEHGVCMARIPSSLDPLPACSEGRRNVAHVVSGLSRMDDMYMYVRKTYLASPPHAHAIVEYRCT